MRLSLFRVATQQVSTAKFLSSLVASKSPHLSGLSFQGLVGRG
jgi:hypothetical protein